MLVWFVLCCLIGFMFGILVVFLCFVLRILMFNVIVRKVIWCCWMCCVGLVWIGMRGLRWVGCMGCIGSCSVLKFIVMCLFDCLLWVRFIMFFLYLRKWRFVMLWLGVILSWVMIILIVI